MTNSSERKYRRIPSTGLEIALKNDRITRIKYSNKLELELKYDSKGSAVFLKDTDGTNWTLAPGTQTWSSHDGKSRQGNVCFLH